MGFVTAHAETQSFAHQPGWLHDKHDLTKSRTLALPSQSVPKQGQAPKVEFDSSSFAKISSRSPKTPNLLQTTTDLLPITSPIISGAQFDLSRFTDFVAHS